MFDRICTEDFVVRYVMQPRRRSACDAGRQRLERDSRGAEEGATALGRHRAGFEIGKLALCGHAHFLGICAVSANCRDRSP